MKILLTCHVRFASAMAWYALNTARGLRDLGHDVYLSTQAGSPLARWATAEKLAGDCDFDLHSANPVHLAQALRRLRQIINSFKPEILNPHCPPGHLFCALANSQSKLPFIRSVSDPRPPNRNLINKRLHESITDGVILTSASSLKRYTSQFQLSKVALQVIHPGLDLDRFPSVPREDWRNKLKIPQSALFAAIIARMSPEKGQEVLLRALTLLPLETRNKTVILMTGDDFPERTAAELHQLAKSLGVENHVRFAPRLNDVRTLLQEIDMGIITSVRSEAVCRIALEMMAYRKPIISSDVNILPEVVSHGVTGFVTPVGDADALARNIVNAIENPERMKTLGDAGRRKLETEFTLQIHARQTVEFYQSLISSRERKAVAI